MHIPNFKESEMRTFTQITLIISLAIMVAAGCSSNSANPVAPMNSNGNNTIPVAQISDDMNHQILGSWIANFNLESLECEVTSSRGISGHYDVTSLLPPPVIVVNSHDPETGIVDVDVTISNTTPMTVYDVRLIIYRDDVGHKLLNDNGWTALYDIPGGYIINPFIAYAKGEVNRQFDAHAEYSENLRIFLPVGDPHVQFAIDASYPGNCEEPYEITEFTCGDLYDEIGSSADVSVCVRDWQDDTDSVNLYCPLITGETLTPFIKVGPDAWELTLVNNTAAPVGDYVSYIIATSANSGLLALYDEVTITVISSGTPTNPQIISTVDCNSRGVFYVDNIVYSASVEDGLEMVYVADPADPYIIADILTDGWANDVEVQDGYAYITDVNSGLFVANVTVDPPSIIGSTGIMEAWRVAVQGDYAYVAWIGFCIVDISNPSSPHVVGTTPVHGVAFDVEVDRSYVYVAVSGGLNVIDASNPAAPVVIATVSEIGHADGLDISGNFAYVTDDREDLSLFIVDISNPAAPVIVSTVDTGGGTEVAVSGDYAYIAMSSGGLVVVDISDTTAPYVLSSLVTDGSSWDVAVNDNYAYLADESGGLKIIQLW